jgi:SH3 domain protein
MEVIERMGIGRFGICGLALVVSLLTMQSGEAVAEQGWVRGEIRLNIRTGPGTQYRIVGGIKTGDGVEVLARGENWTKVRMTVDGEVREGWIPEGYLKPEPPPTIRLERAESRVITLAQELDTLKGESGKLRDTNEILSTQDTDQQAKIKDLTMDNMELRAGARYPEWITGASIFASGMVAGAMVHRRSARRQPSRIRL